MECMMMKAFAIDHYKDDVVLRDLPKPEPRDGEVLVEIYAASVNPVDIKIKNGEFKAFQPHPMPLILGCDMAGVVVGVGTNVRQLKVGDEVYASPDMSHIGTLAEYIVLNESDVAVKPVNLSMEEAASIPLVGLTAWQVLVERAGLKQGQKVLIHAGSGGVGTFAIQLAKHLGATVATTTSTANVALVKSLGADIIIDYKKQAFEQVLNDYDVVFNSLDMGTLEKSISVLKPGGKLISISGPPDTQFAREQGMNWLLQKLMGLLSFNIRRKARRQRINYSFLLMQSNGAQLSKITSLIEAGDIRPVIDQVFPFEKIPDALAHIQTGHAKGKLVVKMK
jgi:NADPH:quinone reductase-like Zn-dependent oxidoreductase